MPDSAGNLLAIPNIHASYGPFNSMNDARADLVNTFGDIAEVPRGYTFCVIENNKPQEYWFTKKGDWSSVEQKNTASGGSVVSNVVFRVANGYIQVAYDGGESADSWTNLVALDDLRGPAGVNGKDGKDGQNGAAGPQGPQGPAGSLDVNEYIRQVAANFGMQIVRTTYTDDEQQVHYEYKVNYRFFNTWYTADGSIRGIEGGGGGGSEPVIRIVTGADGNKYWEVDGVIMVDELNHPVRANGIDGENGTDGQDGRDGQDAEAEYTKFKSIAFKRSNSTPATPPTTDGTYEDPTPRASGWSDGIPTADAYGNTEAQLWMTTRWFSKDPAFMENPNMSYWTDPQPATDTADIDLEYSNAPLDTDRTILGNPTGNPWSAGNPNGWYDADAHPELLGDANWQAIRTMKNGIWGNWTIYKIRGENGSAGVSPAATFKTHVFRRSNAVMSSSDPQYDPNRTDVRLPSTEWPVGGSYDSPIPTNVDGQGNPLWHDGIPEGTGKIWEAVATVVSDSDVPPVWSEPAPISDTEFMDYEWCDRDDLDTYMGGVFKKPSRTSPDDEHSGRLPGDPWYDDPEGPDAPENPNPVWKAERKIHNGEYEGNWFVYRIKGENGTNGTSITISGQLFGVYGPVALGNLTLAEEYYAAHYNELGTAKYAIFGEVDNWTKIYEFSMVDGNVVSTDITSSMSIGDMYMFDGDGYIWDGDNFFNAGRIQGPEGPAGKSWYIHIKYSNDPRVLTDPGNADFSGHGGEDPGEYIGIRTDNTYDDSSNPADYEWKKWQGEDGFGYEYIFKLTNKEDVDAQGNPVAPLVSSANTEYSTDKSSAFQGDDYVPDGWTDDPQSPYKDKPYCWVAYRQKINSLWTSYRGSSASSGARAALFSMYSSKGRGLQGVAEKYAVWDDPIHGPELSNPVWQDGIPQFDPDAGYIYLWNYEIITYDDGSAPVTTTPACIGFWQEGLSIYRIEEFYYATSVNSVTGLPGYRCDNASHVNRNNESGFNPQGGNGWDRNPENQRLSKDKIYLWNYEVVTFRKGNEELTEEQRYFVSKPVIIAYYNYTDVEYLLTLFKKVEGDSDTAYLGGLLGVVEKDPNDPSVDVLRGMLNATDLGKDGDINNGGKGKLMFATGFNGKDDVANATFKVFENGHMEARDATVIDADIQGYLRQYCYRQHEVYDASSGIHKFKKDVNAIQLGWEGLTFIEDGESYSFSDNYVDVSFLENLPPGRILLTNQIYSLKDGSVFFNNRCQLTKLGGRFVYQSGQESSIIGDNIYLKNGWVELLHIRCKDTSYNDIVPNDRGSDKFIILSYGGNIEITGSVAQTKTDANDKYVNEEQSEYNLPTNKYHFGESITATYLNLTDNLIRLCYNNKYIYIDSTVYSQGNVNPIYITLPQGTFNYSAGNRVEFLIRKASANTIIFKEEVLGSITPSADVPNLNNPWFGNMTGNTITDNGLYRITKYSSFWIIERLQSLN